MESSKKVFRVKEFGHTLLECVWALLLGGTILSAVSILFLNVSRIAATLSLRQEAIASALKTHEIIAAAVRSTERNRLYLSVSITPGDALTVAHGGRHPVAAITGTSAPRADSDVVSFIDLDNSFRGTVRSSRISSTSTEVEVCGLNLAPASNSFRSYLLLSISGARQITGPLSHTSRGCAQISGSRVNGLISDREEMPRSFSGFVPVEREYSIFADRSGSVRLVSHVGTRLLENQPLLRGIHSFRLSENIDSSGTLIFQVWIKPSGGPEVRRSIVPALARRALWSEVLP